MPLDVQPLSLARRGLALVVLIAILGLSLVAAQAIIVSRRAAPVSLSLSLPSGYQVAQTRAGLPERYRVWRVPRRNAERQLVEIIAPTTKPATFEGVTEAAVEQFSHFGLRPDARTSATLGRTPALFFSCVDEDKARAALARATIVDGYVVLLMWQALDVPIDVTDLQQFNAICGNAVVLVSGKPYVPQSGTKAFVPASQE